MLPAAALKWAFHSHPLVSNPPLHRARRMITYTNNTISGQIQLKCANGDGSGSQRGNPFGNKPSTFYIRNRMEFANSALASSPDVSIIRSHTQVTAPTHPPELRNSGKMCSERCGWKGCHRRCHCGVFAGGNRGGRGVPVIQVVGERAKYEYPAGWVRTVVFIRCVIRVQIFEQRGPPATTQSWTSICIWPSVKKY